MSQEIQRNAPAARAPALPAGIAPRNPEPGRAPSFETIDPVSANNLLAAGKAVLIDVRTAEELKAGFVPGSFHIAWQQGAAMTKNPRFVKELSQKVEHDAVVLFICRSGRRSADAALTAAKAGYLHAFNVLEGVEGNFEADGGGWRKRGLPWTLA